MSHTFVTCGVSQPTYDEVAALLREADYGHAFGADGTIDMHGLALVLDPAKEPRAVVSIDRPQEVPAAANDEPATIQVSINTGLKDYAGAPPQVGAQFAADALAPLITGIWQGVGPEKAAGCVAGILSYLGGLMASNFTPEAAADMLRSTADKIIENADAFRPTPH